jgi:hypothetical protein
MSKIANYEKETGKNHKAKRKAAKHLVNHEENRKNYELSTKKCIVRK